MKDCSSVKGCWYDSSMAAAHGGVLLSAAVALTACGPSFQAIYEGNVRFEHCYALEENPQAAMPDKAACWRDWSERYTYGQTRDRIHYATARYVALAEARDIPTDEALMMAAPGETPRKSTIMAPAPTNAFAPPPKVLDPTDAAATGRPLANASDVPSPTVDAGAAAGAAALAATPCTDQCAVALTSCSLGPASDAGSAAKKKRGDACLRSYRACMRGCFD